MRKEAQLTHKEQEIVNQLIYLIDNDRDDIWESFRKECNFHEDYPANAILFDTAFFDRVPSRDWEKAINDAHVIDDVIHSINNRKVYWGLDPAYLGMRPYSGPLEKIPQHHIVVKTFNNDD